MSNVIHKRKYYRRAPPSGKQKSVEANICGLLFTTDTSEKQAVREAHNILAELLEYPGNVKQSESDEQPAVLSSPQTGSRFNSISSRDCQVDDDSDGEDIADSVKKFCASQCKKKSNELNKSDPKILQRPTGVNHCLFFKVDTAHPSEIYDLADRLFEKSVKSPFCRSLQRVFPVEVTCPVNLVILREELSKMISQHFKQKEDGSWPSYAVEFKSRNNDCINRSLAFEIVDDAIKMLSQCIRVKLNFPDITILFQILHKTAMLSCVKLFYERKRFSLHQELFCNINEKYPKVDEKLKKSEQDCSA